MHPMGFEPAIPESELPQTHALDLEATGIGVTMFISIPDAGKIILTANETSVTVLTLSILVSLCLLCPVRLLWTRDNNTSPPDH
jgi:hypothetical protein